MGKSLSRLWDRISRLWRRNPEPQDPYAGVRVPLKRGPHGRSAAVALLEPEDTDPTHARGRRAS